MLYENVSPDNITFPFIFWHAIFKLVDLSTSLTSNLVVKVANWSGKASEPIWLIVTLGLVIFNFITYSSFSSSNKAFASSTSKSSYLMSISSSFLSLFFFSSFISSEVEKSKKRRKKEILF